MELKKKYHFYAGHRNKEAGEKCGRIHGHTYDVEVILKFEEMKNGVTMLFSDVDQLIEPIIKEYDHWLLLHEEDSLVEVLTLANEEFKTLPFATSAENMAIWLFTRIKNETKLPIKRINLAETKTSIISYEP